MRGRNRPSSATHNAVDAYFTHAGSRNGPSPRPRRTLIMYFMRAVKIVDESLKVEEAPEPVAGAGELLVRVRAAGINGADILQKRGHYPAPPGVPADIPGLEFAGEVVSTGDGVQRFTTGDRVMGIVGGGAQAEYVTIHERVAMPVPDAVDWTTAGALPEVFTTAYDALVLQASLGTGDRVLINGGAGGVGTAAIQIATLMGAFPVATVRTPEMAERLREALDVSTVVAEAGSDAAVERGPFNVVLELVGAANLRTNLKALARNGRLCFIGVGAGPKSEFNALHLMGKRASIHGSTLRSLPLEDKAVIARAVEAGLLAHFDNGTLRVTVDRSFGLDEAPAAYDYFTAGGKLGKVTLTM